jgi:hypothetical protein
MINPKPVKTLKLFPFNGARWLACYIKDHSIDLADLICYAGGDFLKNFIGNTRPIGGHGILG